MSETIPITSRLITEEMQKRGWEFTTIKGRDGHLIEFTMPNGTKGRLISNMGEWTTGVAREIADDKWLAYEFAKRLEVPCPKSIMFTDMSTAESFLQENSRIVVKPRDGAHGHGVTLDVMNKDKLEIALKSAQLESDEVLLQTMHTGDDYRILVIGYKVVAAAIRKPAHVIGDGVSTIDQLIERENQSGERADHYKKQLNYIDVAAAKRYLGERMQEIPAKDIEVTVVGTANIGTGGTAIDVTERLDPRLKDMAEKMARAVDMPVCGVDFIMNDQEINFIEINASPSFGLHVNPSVGEPQPVVEAFFEWVEAWYASRKS